MRFYKDIQLMKEGQTNTPACVIEKAVTDTANLPTVLGPLVTQYLSKADWLPNADKLEGEEQKIEDEAERFFGRN